MFDINDSIKSIERIIPNLKRAYQYNSNWKFYLKLIFEHINEVRFALLTNEQKNNLKSITTEVLDIFNNPLSKASYVMELKEMIQFKERLESKPKKKQVDLKWLDYLEQEIDKLEAQQQSEIRG